MLGKTGMSVSVLGLGGAEIGFESATVATVDRLLGAALDHGISLVDTAECYHASEEMIGQCIGGRRNNLYIFTKCGHGAGFPVTYMTRGLNRLLRAAGRSPRFGYVDWNKRTLEESIERSLRRLRTDCLDLLQLHSCSEETLRRGEVIEILQRARKSGKTRFIGYSGDGPDALHAVKCGAFDTLQTSVNIADQQGIDMILPQARERGMGVIAKRPLANAVWRNSSRPNNSYHHVYWDRLQKLRYEFLEDGGASVGVALRFTLTVPGIHTAIVGTTKPDRCQQNTEVVAGGLLHSSQYEGIRTRWNTVACADWIVQA